MFVPRRDGPSGGPHGATTAHGGRHNKGRTGAVIPAGHEGVGSRVCLVVGRHAWKAKRQEMQAPREAVHG